MRGRILVRPLGFLPCFGCRWGRASTLDKTIRTSTQLGIQCAAKLHFPEGGALAWLSALWPLQSRVESLLKRLAGTDEKSVAFLDGFEALNDYFAQQPGGDGEMAHESDVFGAANKQLRRGKIMRIQSQSSMAAWDKHKALSPAGRQGFEYGVPQHIYMIAMP